MNQDALAPFVAFVVTLVAVPLSSALARRVGAVVVPRPDRWNVRSVPTLGGLGIGAAIVAGLLFAPIPAIDRVALITGTIAFMALGLIDDLAFVRPWIRLGLEGLAGVAFVLIVTPDFDPALRLAGIVVAAVAVPVAINATNLVDNADGLASSLSIVTATTLAALALTVGGPSHVGVAALVVAAACGAFLLFNRPPAGVFMGDSGSLSLGFALAAVAILIVRDSVADHASTRLAVGVVLPLAFSLQVGDLAMVFVTRYRRGASPFMGGVDHTSHRLLARGLSPARMVIALGTLAALLGAVAVVLAIAIGDFRLVAVLALTMAAIVGAFETVVAWRLPRARPVTPIVSEAPDPGRQLAPDPTVRLTATSRARRR